MFSERVGTHVSQKSSVSIVVIYGIIAFTQKIYQLLKLKQSVMYNEHENEGEFDDQQQNLLHTTTKYTTLLSFAMITSFINQTYLWFYNIYLVMYPYNYDRTRLQFFLLSTSFTSIDIVINIICLFLQYPFNKHYYDKYCKCIANCCTKMMVRKWEQKHKTQENGNDEINLANMIRTGDRE